MAVRSVLLLECLERSGYFPEGSTEEDRDCVLRRLYDFQGESHRQRVSIQSQFQFESIQPQYQNPMSRNVNQVAI